MKNLKKMFMLLLLVMFNGELLTSEWKPFARINNILFGESFMAPTMMVGERFGVCDVHVPEFQKVIQNLNLRYIEEFILCKIQNNEMKSIENGFSNLMTVISNLQFSNRPMSENMQNQMAQLLFKYKVDINFQKNGQSALTDASMLGNIEKVNFLINLGADVNISDQSELIYPGLTPLMRASQAMFSSKNYISIIKLLINSGARLNEQSKNGETALIYAAQENKPEIVYILLINDADTALVDKEGKNFLDYAQNKPEVLQAIERAREYKIARRQILHEEIERMPDVLVDMINEY